jgi:voltage-gated potassium channel
MKTLREIPFNFEQRGHRTLLLALLTMLLVSPFFQQYDTFQWLLAVIFTLVLLAAVRTVANRAGQYRVALVLAVLAVVPQFGVLIERSEWLETVRYLAMMLFLFWVCALLLRNIIVRSHAVTTDLILGAINIYLMVGVAFAFMFGLIEQLQPGSFTGLGESLLVQDPVYPLIYFSFITLTTLGYGDITPITSFGMTAAYIEAMFAQLYLAILVARLVGLYIGQRGVTDENKEHTESEHR